MIGRYESGLLSTLEVATDLLCEIDAGFLSSLPSLPNEVRQTFLGILREIREADFSVRTGDRWKPPLLTASKNPLSDGTEYSAKLRRVIAMFGP